MDDSPAMYLIAILVLLLLAAYFAGTEISLASVNRIRVANRAEDGDQNLYGRLIHHVEQGVSKPQQSVYAGLVDHACKDHGNGSGGHRPFRRYGKIRCKLPWQT